MEVITYMPAFNLYIGKRDKELIKRLPRDVSMSKIVKWLLLAIVLPEKDLHKRMMANKDEVKEVAERLADILGRFIKND